MRRRPARSDGAIGNDPMTSADEPLPDPAPWRLDPSWLSVVWAVVRRLWPYLIEATVVPTAAYYLFLTSFGQVWGIVAASVCTYLSVGRRLLLRQPVPGLLLVASVGITVRLGIYLLNHSEFMYFVQPVAKTGATALLFATSVLIGKPLVARFAADFCSFDDTVGARPAITSLFRRLTYLWAGAQFTVAAINLTLLMTVPVAVFVGTAAGTAWLVMSIGVAITVADAVRTTRHDGLRTALATGGHLHAFVTTEPVAPLHEHGPRAVCPGPS